MKLTLLILLIVSVVVIYAKPSGEKEDGDAENSSEEKIKGMTLGEAYEEYKSIIPVANKVINLLRQFTSVNQECMQEKLKLNDGKDRTVDDYPDMIAVFAAATMECTDNAEEYLDTLFDVFSLLSDIGILPSMKQSELTIFKMILRDLEPESSIVQNMDDSKENEVDQEYLNEMKKNIKERMSGSMAGFNKKFRVFETDRFTIDDYRKLLLKTVIILFDPKLSDEVKQKEKENLKGVYKNMNEVVSSQVLKTMLED